MKKKENKKTPINKEVKERAVILSKVINKRMSQKEVVAELDISFRQIRNLLTIGYTPIFVKEYGK